MYMSKIPGWLLAGLMIATVAFAASNRPTIDRGAKAPEFTAQDMAGKRVQLSQLLQQDKVQGVLLTIWSKNCPVCTRDLPNLEKVHQLLKKRNIIVLGVNIDRADAGTLKEYYRRQKLTFRSILDPDRAITKKYGAEVTPTTYLIDKQGIVQARYDASGINAQTQKMILADIDQLLETGKVSPKVPAVQRIG